jgi:chemotaxis methyl-accepting protein methylase
MEDSHFRQILGRFGLSWQGYRRVRKGVKKRLVRHMQETGCRNIEDYIQAIEADRNVKMGFERLMTVSISRFFRDRDLWQAIQDRILPILAESPRAVTVWSAGCASGEEVYSFKILWEALRNTRSPLPDVTILGTDICPAYLERAQAAVYSASTVGEVPEALRSACFEKTPGGKYALKPWVKTGISWQAQNLLSDPPGTVFDLVFLRNNLLTYYNDQVKIPAMMKVIDSLAPGGFLIIGSHEKMPIERKDLKR